MRAFISYSHTDRHYGAQTKAVLVEVGIDGFLAHEDLQVSELWRERIVEELRSCELFVPLLSANFLKSAWAPQEVGFIASRTDVVIAPLSIDRTIPFGFISHIQACHIPAAGITSELLVEPLARSMPRKILPRLIRIALEASSFRDAEAKMRPLVPHFRDLTADEAQTLAAGAVKNGQVWDAAECRTELLPEFLQHQRANLSPETLRALEYQIKNGEWYRGDAET